MFTFRRISINAHSYNYHVPFRDHKTNIMMCFMQVKGQGSMLLATKNAATFVGCYLLLGAMLVLVSVVADDVPTSAESSSSHMANPLSSSTTSYRDLQQQDDEEGSVVFLIFF